ncbi:alpha/beta fold hydrolase [Urechidicola vernalis]|uniref:Alpha/beta fold hydrolase n=1 Tax=Urechidicola vernalis TaxID=3075600 RepID=A0ABU2Y631_9FLAO|nr:alpha/beta fold hydrolase [Urechidicola sp. P050]MDT0553142.1 alpha/beta fold hydrolase [Urechidicola sp. P050]
MTQQLQHITISDFTTETGYTSNFDLTFQIFGKPLHTAPIVQVSHALTGNSEVAGENGWWSGIIGKGKLIDTDKFTIISFDIPGNGYDENSDKLIKNYKDFKPRDIAKIFGLGLQKLEISKLYAVIGPSLGGGIAWEMAVLFPDLMEHLVALGSDWKTSDWIIAHNLTQEQILNNSKRPMHDARLMAMLFYRTAVSFKHRFNRSTNEELGIFNSESWLLHHGKRIEERFNLESYQLMNHLLTHIDITRGRGEFVEVAKLIKAKVTQVTIDTDIFFVPEENVETEALLNEAGVRNELKEIKSIYGHDGFLIEFDQLNILLKDIF